MCLQGVYNSALCAVCLHNPFMPEFNTFCKQRLTTLPSNHIPCQWTVAKSNRWSGQLVSRRARKRGAKEHKRIKEEEGMDKKMWIMHYHTSWEFKLNFFISIYLLLYPLTELRVASQLIVELIYGINNRSHPQLSPIHLCTCILIHVTALWQEARAHADTRRLAPGTFLLWGTSLTKSLIYVGLLSDTLVHVY